MNIFKILASGDGSINEPNVSAFLGYLLNPKADHGLGDSLLKEFINKLISENIDNKESDLKSKKKKEINHQLKDLVDINNEVRNLSIYSDFEIKILLEQAFYSNSVEKKENQIVDIIILCYKKENQKKNKQSLAQKSINKNNDGELVQIFLIENKIRQGATRELQLEKQYENTINKLEEIGIEEITQKISVIFVAPSFDEESKKSDVYDDFKTKYPQSFSTRIFWDDNDNNDDESMSMILKNILNLENIAEIEPITDYTKHTLKSFINFIDNGFKSSIEEDLGGAKPKRKFKSEINFFEYHKKEKAIPENIINLGEEISDFISNVYAGKLIHRYSPTHYSFFLKEFNYKPGTKLATLELFPKKAGIHFRNKNIDGVLDKIKLTPIIQKSWPDLRFFNFTQFTDSEKNDLAILLKASYNSVTSAYNQ